MDPKNRNEYANSLIHRNIKEWNPQANIYHDMKEDHGSYIHTYEGFDHFPASKVSHSLSRINAEYGTKVNPITGQNQFYMEIPKSQTTNNKKQFSFFQKAELFIEVVLLLFYFIVFQKEWMDLLHLSS